MSPSSTERICVFAGSSVRRFASQRIQRTAGGRGSRRSQDPCAATTAPPDHGAGTFVPSRKDMPSGAEWAGMPTSIGARLPQSSATPPGLVVESGISGTSASEPGGVFFPCSGLQSGQPRSRPWTTGTTSSTG